MTDPYKTKANIKLESELCFLMLINFSPELDIHFFNIKKIFFNLLPPDTSYLSSVKYPL